MDHRCRIPARGMVALVTLALAVVGSPLGVWAEEGSLDSLVATDQPVFLFFHVDGCDFCEEQKPIIEELEGEWEAEIAFMWIDGEEDPQMVEEFGVESYPAMFVVVDRDGSGYVYQHFRGFTGKEELNDGIAYALSTGKVRQAAEDDIVGCPSGATSTSWQKRIMVLCV